MKTYYIYLNNVCIMEIAEKQPDIADPELIKQLALSAHNIVFDNPECNIAVYKDGSFMELIKVR